MAKHLSRHRLILLEDQAKWWRAQELKLGVECERIVWPKCFDRPAYVEPVYAPKLYVWNRLAAWLDGKTRH